MKTKLPTDKQKIDRLTAWIKALRSGEYKQARYVLRHEDNFCCLGVACDIFRKRTKLGSWVSNLYQEHNKDFKLSKSKESEVMIRGVYQYFGFKEGNPQDSDKNESSLASLNDRGKSFKFIANVIEKVYLEPLLNKKK